MSFFKRCFLLLSLAPACLTGCARYSPKPLDPEITMKQLNAVSLADLVSSGVNDKKIDSGVLNLSKGLDEDGVATVALLLNPELKATYLQKGIAEGQLVTAGLWPNPTFDNKSLLSSSPVHSHKSIEGSLSIELLRWEERAGEKQAKKANVEAVQWDVLSQEWKTITDARTAYWQFIANSEKLKVNQELEQLNNKLTASVKDRLSKGAASSLEVNQAELQEVRLHADGLKLASEQSASLRDLRRVMGLPPDAELPIFRPEKPFARNARTWTPTQLEGLLITSGPLKALEWRYKVSEGELRAAIARQYPGLKVGPSGTFDYDGYLWSSLSGFVATFDLPLLHRNQGEIKEKQAAREVARALYEAGLHSARANLADAVAKVTAIEGQLDFQEREILPKAQESLHLFEHAVSAGELEGFQILQTQATLLDTKQAYLDILIEYRKALLGVEVALGHRLSDTKDHPLIEVPLEKQSIHSDHIDHP